MKGIGRKAIIWGGALVLVLVGLLAGGGIFILKRPHFDSLVPPFSSSVQAHILTPRANSTFPADSFIPIQVSGAGTLPLKTMELWINGKLFGTQSPGQSGSTAAATIWHWQPGREGTYTLLARVVDEQDHAGVSEAVTIAVQAAAGYTELVTSQAGDTIATLAAQYGTTAEKIAAANPQLAAPAAGQEEAQGNGEPLPPPVSIDPEGPLPPDIIVYIPHMTAQIGTEFFPPLQEGDQVGDQNGDNPAEPSTPGEPPSVPQFEISNGLFPDFINKFNFQLSSTLNPASEAPSSPLISLWTEQNGQWDHPCHPMIQIEQTSKNEDGFFVYRSGGGDATLKRIGAVDKPDPGYAGGTYTDMEKISGIFTYVASAYNSKGENFSGPLVVDLSKCDYTPVSSKYVTEETTTGGVTLVNGVLTLPSSVDLAYLYVGINNVFWQRVPPGSSNFLSGSGYQFNLDSYLAGLIGQIDDTDLAISIEVWGWQGGQVGMVGSYSANLHRVVLAICTAMGENQCVGLGGSSTWGREVVLSPDIPVEQQSYNLRISMSPALNAEDLQYRVAVIGVGGGYDIELTKWLFCDYNVGKCGDVATLHAGGTVYLPFSMGNYYNLDAANMEYDISQYYGYNKPFTVRIRVTPVDQQGNPGAASDTVLLHYLNPVEAEDLPLASNLPSLYTVQIMPETYQPPIFLNTINWGCVIVQNNYGDYYQGEAICPPDLDKGPGNWDAGSILGGEADLIAGGLTDLGQYLEQAKDAIVSAVASVIPGCGDECKSYLKKGLEAGFMALTGIPPTIPNFDELSSQGILYAVDQVQSSITGYECGSTCVDALKGQLTSAIQQARQQAALVSCGAPENVAHFFNKESGWCLPPQVIVAPYPGGSNQPGGVFVQVTRNSTPAPAGDLKTQYFLDIATQGTNDQRAGTFGNGCTYTQDGYYVEDPDHYYLLDDTYAFTDTPAVGELYTKVRVPMPLLQPGESMVIPIGFQPFGFDSTKIAYMPPLGCNGFADFEYLFYKGSSSITAAEYCFVADNNTVVPCTLGGTDTFNTTNPWNPANQWP